MGNLLIANSNFLFNLGIKDNKKKLDPFFKFLSCSVSTSVVLVDLGIVATAIKLLSSGVQSV